MSSRINIFGISGGKDSTALAVWALQDSGYDRDSLRFTFCDTGNEAPETYEYVLNYLPQKLGVDIIILKPERDFYDLAAHKGMFPNPVSRFCTESLKILPTRRYVLDLLEQGFDVLSHAGSRRGESHNRRGIEEYSIRNWGSNTNPMFVNVRNPLYLWSLADVWAYLEKHAVERNPLYYRGAERVGCYPCIMSKLGEIAKIPAERVDFIEAKEAEVNYSIAKTKTGVFTPFFPTMKIPLRFRDVKYDRVIKPKRVKNNEGGLFPELSHDAPRRAIGTCASVRRVWEYSRSREQEKKPVLEIDWEEEGAVCPSEGAFCE